jgi:hypothetical protein
VLTVGEADEPALALVRARHRAPALALEFGFFLVSARLLLDPPFRWRDLIPGAAVCTVAAAIVHTMLIFFLRNWFAEYGRAYGGFGVGLALTAAVGIIASFWVWIAAVMDVYWEHRAGPPPLPPWRNCPPRPARRRPAYSPTGDARAENSAAIEPARARETAIKHGSRPAPRFSDAGTA